jgi:vanillate O-demethylase ferredoxin subunit
LAALSAITLDKVAIDSSPDALGWRTLLVAATTEETAEIKTFDLVDPAGAMLPGFTAGAHIDVEAAPHLIRQYSLMNNPAERHRYRIGVLKDATSRGGSVAMHAIGPGALLRIAGPRNHFELATGSHPAILLAGGIGITPLLAMAHRLHHTGQAFTLHYCARSPAHAAFLDDLKHIDFTANVLTHFDNGPDAQRLDLPAVISGAPPDVHIYVCGPGGFMAWCIETLAGAGIAESRIHREYFKAPTITTAPPAATFEVQLSSSGAVIAIPADRSILDVLRDHGIQIPASCKTGVCGTCLTGLVSGTADHRDIYLSKEERAANDVILPCCSRAKSSRLVLDL